jgi:hypothetical protein
MKSRGAVPAASLGGRPNTPRPALLCELACRNRNISIVNIVINMSTEFLIREKSVLGLERWESGWLLTTAPMMVLTSSDFKPPLILGYWRLCLLESMALLTM